MELQSTIFKRLMLLLDTELQMPVHEGLQFSTTFILQEHTNIAFHALGTSKLVIWLLITHALCITSNFRRGTLGQLPESPK